MLTQPKSLSYRLPYRPQELSSMTGIRYVPRYSYPGSLAPFLTPATGHLSSVCSVRSVVNATTSNGKTACLPTSRHSTICSPPCPHLPGPAGHASWQAASIFDPGATGGWRSISCSPLFCTAPSRGSSLTPSSSGSRQTPVAVNRSFSNMPTETSRLHEAGYFVPLGITCTRQPLARSALSPS